MDIITYALIKKKLSKKADLDSPHFTGIPTAPTAEVGTDTDQIATTAFVQNEIAQLEDTKYTFTSNSYTLTLEGTDGTVQTVTLPIYSNTTAGWNVDPGMVSELGALYIFTDASVKDGMYIPAIKIGDGQACIVDLPFTDILYREHILNSTIHITQEEREFWNNKVTCYLNSDNREILVFSKEDYRGA